MSVAGDVSHRIAMGMRFSPARDGMFWMSDYMPSLRDLWCECAPMSGDSRHRLLTCRPVGTGNPHRKQEKTKRHEGAVQSA